MHGGTLMKIWREEIDPWKTLALAWSQTFSEVGSTNRLWWPDLTWPGQFFLSKCAQWMFGRSHQVWAFYFAAFGNGTRKTWGGGGRPPPPARNRVNIMTALLSWVLNQQIAELIFMGRLWRLSDNCYLTLEQFPLGNLLYNVLEAVTAVASDKRCLFYR